MTWLMVLCLGAACETTQERPGEGDPAPRNRESLDVVFAPAMERLSVAADELSVDVSRELWDRFGYPAHGALHSMEVVEGPPRTYRFRNVAGGLSVPLSFRIGSQTWLILHEAVFRLHATGTARFDLEASGSVLVSRPGQEPRACASLRISEGRWRELPE